MLGLLRIEDEPGDPSLTHSLSDTREAGVRAQYPPPPPPPEPPPPYRTKNAMTTTTSTATPAINHTFLVMFTYPGYRSPSAQSVYTRRPKAIYEQLDSEGHAAHADCQTKHRWVLTP